MEKLKEEDFYEITDGNTQTKLFTFWKNLRENGFKKNFEVIKFSGTEEVESRQTTFVLDNIIVITVYGKENLRVGLGYRQMDQEVLVLQPVAFTASWKNFVEFFNSWDFSELRIA